MVRYRFGAERTKLALAITRTAILYGPPPYSAMSATTSAPKLTVSSSRSDVARRYALLRVSRTTPARLAP